MFSVGFQRFKADVAIYLHDKGCIPNKVSPADRVEKEKEVSLSFVKSSQIKNGFVAWHQGTYANCFCYCRMNFSL